MKQKRRDIYQEVTDRVINLLESGNLPPWRQPIEGSADPFPKNHKTQKAYRGINVWLLKMTSWTKGYETNRWLTYKQTKELGGMVRKGEEGTLVTFWKTYAKKEKETGEETTLPVLRHYTVFNLEQTDGIENPEQSDVEEHPFEPIQRAKAITKGFVSPPLIEHRGYQAFYKPETDTVRIAKPERFTEREAYYSTLFHELIHATGHPKRLDRCGSPTPFGSADYSKEELVAEMGSAFLCAAAGISPATIEQAAAYLEGWTRTLKGDNKLVIQAAGQAQKAADHILGWEPENS